MGCKYGGEGQTANVASGKKEVNSLSLGVISSIENGTFQDTFSTRSGRGKTRVARSKRENGSCFCTGTTLSVS